MKPLPPAAWRTYRRLLGYARPYRHYLAAAGVGMVVEAASAGLFAKLMEPMVNETFVARDPGVRWTLPLAIVGLFLLRGLATFVTDYGMARAGRSVGFASSICAATAATMGAATDVPSTNW